MSPDCIYFKNFTSRIICKRNYYSAAIRGLLFKPDEILADSSLICLKDDHTSTVKIVTIDGIKLLVKRYNIRSFWYRVKHCLLSTRAMRSWRNMHLLLQFAIPTALPIAVIEKRFGILRGESYLITEYVDGVNGFTYFADKTKTAGFATTIANIVKFAQRFAKFHLTHGDPQLGNMIIVNNSPVFIDLDRAHKFRGNNCFYRRARKRDLRILTEHPKDNPAIRAQIKRLLCT